MMKKVLYFCTLLMIAACGLVLHVRHTGAFTSNNLMSDVVLDESNSMSASQINSWLNANFPSSCISTNGGFSAPDPTGYSPSGGFTYGAFTSAGQVIYDAAQAYDINPEVLLATLQKEQSLVSGSGGCTTLAYTAAAGYGCPDGGSSYSYSGLELYAINGTVVSSVSGTCVNSAAKAGFSQQIIRAAWLLKFGEQRSEGNTSWAIIKGSWDNSDDPQTCYGGPMTEGYRSRIGQQYATQSCPYALTYYDGYTVIDGTSTHMDNGATAALYWYTPHFAGNENFDSIFTAWFGSPYPTVPYLWQYDGQWAYSDSGRTQPFTAVPTVAPGGTIYVKVQAKNAGTQTWNQSTLHLGTSHPMDRVSQFATTGWLSDSRPAQMTESSVLPGGIATFEFAMKAPSTPGTYKEYFNVLVEGLEWLNDPGMFFTINVNNSASANNSNVSELTSGQSISKNGYLLSPDSQTVLSLQSDGNLVEYSNFVKSWSTGAFGSSANKLIMQSDGNLVLYDQNMHALWDSQTGGNPGAWLVLQTDGNMVIYSSSNAALWATYTIQNPDHLAYVNTTLYSGRMYPGQSLNTADRKYSLILQPDGNLVLYSTSGALWASGTDGKQSAFLAMQTDGNLVLYDQNGHPLWYSGTAGRPYLHLVVQQDGNLVLYDNWGIPYWNTQTNN